LFLALITISKAGITLAHAAQYPVVPNNLQKAQYLIVYHSSAFIVNDSQPHDDFHGLGKLKYWLEFDDDFTWRAT